MILTTRKRWAALRLARLRGLRVWVSVQGLGFRVQAMILTKTLTAGKDWKQGGFRFYGLG